MNRTSFKNKHSASSTLNNPKLIYVFFILIKCLYLYCLKGSPFENGAMIIIVTFQNIIKF